MGIFVIFSQKNIIYANRIRRGTKSGTTHYPKELGYPAFYFLTNTASPVDVSISSFDDFSSNDNKSLSCPSIELTSL